MAETPQPPNAWNALKPGDSIYLIAPSTPADNGTVAYATEIFAQMGLKAIVSPDINANYYFHRPVMKEIIRP